MGIRFTKDDCPRFSAHLRSDARIEIRIDGNPWNQESGLKSKFVFHQDKARLGLEMLEEIDRYVESEGEWPDWNDARQFSGKMYSITMEKHGHNWQRKTGYIRMKGRIRDMNYTLSFGTLKALAFLCCAIAIEDIVGQ